MWPIEPLREAVSAQVDAQADNNTASQNGFFGEGSARPMIHARNIDITADNVSTPRIIYQPGKVQKIQDIRKQMDDDDDFKGLIRKHLEKYGISSNEVAEKAFDSTKDVIEKYIRQNHADRASKEFDFSGIIKALQSTDPASAITLQMALSDASVGRFMAEPTDDSVRISYDGNLGIMTIEGTREAVQEFVNKIYFHADVTKLKHFWVDIKVQPANHSPGESWLGGDAKANESGEVKSLVTELSARILMLYEKASGFYVAQNPVGSVGTAQLESPLVTLITPQSEEIAIPLSKLPEAQRTLFESMKATNETNDSILFAEPVAPAPPPVTPPVVEVTPPDPVEPTEPPAPPANEPVVIPPISNPPPGVPAPPNTPPVADDATFAMDENSAASTSVGTVTATDADAADTLSYAITAGNTDVDADGNDAFNINAATGEITVNDADDLDFETTPSFTLSVQVSDNGAPVESDTATISVNLNDVDDLTAAINDNLASSAGGDAFSGIAAHWHTGDTVDGGAGNDTLTISSGSVNVTIDGANYTGFEEVETLVLPDATHSITIDDDYFGRGAGPNGDILTINASAASGDVTIDGGALSAPHVLYVTTGSGDDTLTGGAGNDSLNGGNGNDSIDAGTGSDTINAGGGDDEVSLAFNVSALPSSITASNDLIAWFDASDIDGDGTNEGAAEAGLNGGLLETWVNKATSATPLGDGTAAGGARPTYTASGSINGQASLAWDGNVNQVDIANNLLIDGTTQHTIFMVSYQTGNGGANFGRLLGHGGGANHILRSSASDGNVTALNSGETVHNFTSHPYAAIYELSIDAGTLDTFDNAAQTLTNEPYAHNINGQVLIGNVGGFDRGFAGEIAELIIYEDTLSGAERDDVRSYLQNKYAIALGAPASSTGDVVYGGAGNDTLTITANTVTTTLDGGTVSEFETLDLTAVDAAHNITLTDAYYTAGVGVDGNRLMVNASGNATGITVDGGALTGAHALSVNGSDGGDSLSSGQGDDSLSGNDGNDTIASGAGDDTITGGNGNDSITAASGHDTITGGLGRDTILAGSGNDTVTGGDGDDSITAGSGDDVVQGNDGNDTITGGSGTDNLDGGAGEDILEGAADSDTIDGGADDDVLHGGDAGDSLSGSGGNDILYGDDGFFQQTAGLIVIEAENYSSKVDSANHSWEITDYAPASGGSVILIADGAGNGGNAGERVSYDVEFTSTGTFYLWVRGTAVLRTAGNSGNADSVFIEVDGVNVTPGANNTAGGPVTGFNDGLNWNSSLTKAQFTIATTGKHTITLLAREDGFAADKILITNNAGFTPTGVGPAENERIVTSGGNDTIIGGEGDDTIYGDLGADTITGGLGQDTMTGGGDADRFVFEAINESPAGARDVITDFQTGSDDIDLSALGLAFTVVSANGTAGGGIGDFTAGPGGPEIAWAQLGGNTIVYVDSDGDDVANMEIELTGLLSLDGGDFIF